MFDALDVKAIRDNLKLSQQQFTNLLGINILTLQHWEQGLILGLFHDTSLEIDTDLLELQRNLSPACKLANVGEMNTAVKMLALVGLKSRYPDNSPEMLRRRLAD